MHDPYEYCSTDLNTDIIQKTTSAPCRPVRVLLGLPLQETPLLVVLCSEASLQIQRDVPAISVNTLFFLMTIII